ncbi:hypothetical protein pdul_cds_891 [Pandoravirus dulcis]|uniref:Uncharacterized protein n=1 Tax=Pandoravirus dulcis TaxID=1349409 RepID=S4VUN9_9VIRU|nr:hypothetical protein pdul_cds_891 [Pandoravirus dulcis]AGO83120.1 hypothetical protein pdul_cds_891 [Pandoravirus dulcis]
MTDYETLAWSRAALDESTLAADDGEAALRGILWKYVSDTRGYVSSASDDTDDDGDDDGDEDQLFFGRHYSARAALVHRGTSEAQSQDRAEDEDGFVDDDDGDNDDDDLHTGEPAWTARCIGDGQRDRVYVVQDARDGTDATAHVAWLLNGTAEDAADGEDTGEEGDVQRTYADALVDTLGNVDEVHLHGDGSVALRKERRLPVLLMGGVAAPAKIADASLTAAQADDGVTVLLGEVALLADEVGAAERALLADDAGAVVTALHNHWVSDPTLYYLHFQALTRDPAAFLNAIAPWWRSL